MARVICLVPLIAAAMSVSGCTAFQNVHDPAYGIVSREQLPGLIKSVRCELITFYEANRQRMTEYKKLLESGRENEIGELRYFPISEQLYGVYLLGLKVQDTIGLVTSNTSLDHKGSVDANHSKTWHLGPTLQVQNTHEFIWNFAIKQNATLDPRVAARNSVGSTSPKTSGLDCYRDLAFKTDAHKLAAGTYPEKERFTRLMVDGLTPLAAWLASNSTIMTLGERNLENEKEEDVTAAQMFHNFTIQISGGIDAKYSLVSTYWSPVALGTSASTQQTSNLQIWINGDSAGAASGAKSGIASWVQGPPTRVVVKNDQDSPVPVTEISKQKSPVTSSQPAAAPQSKSDGENAKPTVQPPGVQPRTGKKSKTRVQPTKPKGGKSPVYLLAPLAAPATGPQ